MRRGHHLVELAGLSIILACHSTSKFWALQPMRSMIRFRAVSDTIRDSMLVHFYALFSIAGECDTEKLALRLVDEANIGLAPGTAFGAGGEKGHQGEARDAVLLPALKRPVVLLVLGQVLEPAVVDHANLGRDPLAVADRGSLGECRPDGGEQDRRREN